MWDEYLAAYRSGPDSPRTPAGFIDRTETTIERIGPWLEKTGIGRPHQCTPVQTISETRETRRNNTLTAGYQPAYDHQWPIDTTLMERLTDTDADGNDLQDRYGLATPPFQGSSSSWVPDGHALADRTRRP